MAKFTRVEVVQKLRRKESLEGTDLSDIDLSRLTSFRNSNLSGANPRNTNLKEATLYSTNLSNANLGETNRTSN